MRRALLAVLLLLAACTSTTPTPQPEPTPPPFSACAPLFTGTAELPSMSLPCFTGGEEVSPARLAGPAVVNFWADWCLPCIEELPAFQRLADKGQVKVLGVVTKTERQGAISLATELGVTFPTVFDHKGKLRAQLGELGMPLTLFVTADGKVTRYLGRPLTDQSLAALVTRHLTPTPTASLIMNLGQGSSACRCSERHDQQEWVVA